jgi:hypothetical protein
MEILQNDDSQICNCWDRFRSKVFNNSTNESLIIDEYGDHDNDIIALIMNRSPFVHRDEFHLNFVVEFPITISMSDTTADIGNNLSNVIPFNANTGLYICRVLSDGNSDVLAPLLIRKDENSFQIAAAIYLTEKNEVLFRLITRSLTGLCDNQFVWSQYQWYSKSAKWSVITATTLPKDGDVIPCKLRAYKLYAIVLIPTRTQTIRTNESNFSMTLYDADERISENWVVNDLLSLGSFSYGNGEIFHLTERVLRTMAFDLMSAYGYDRTLQSCIVSASLVDELCFFMEHLNHLKSTSSSMTFSSANSSLSNFPSTTFLSTSSPNSLQFSPQLINVRDQCGFRNEIVHFLVSYQDSKGINIWVYAYLIAKTQTLVILTRRSDPVREILRISSSIKFFLDVVLYSKLKIMQLLWRGEEVCRGNSGYYAVKQFWKNADNIKSCFSSSHDSPAEYLQMIEKLQRKLNANEEPRRPKWMLKEITNDQVIQLKKRTSAYMFESKHFYIDDINFLLND